MEPERTIDHSAQQRKLRKYDLMHHAGELLPNNRVATCMKHRISADSPVELILSDEGKAGYGNVIRCGSVWDCPVCAAKITEERKNELQEAVTRWKEAGKGVALLTLTLQHFKHEDLAEIITGLQSALSGLWRQRSVREIAVAVGVVGKIRSMEVLWGQENGWHPHSHFLLFFEHNFLTPAQVHELESTLAGEWQNVLKKGGRWASIENGIDLRWADSAIADYVAKFGGSGYETEQDPENWSIEAEMTKSGSKTGRMGSVHPFELLSLSAMGEKWAGRLFKEYSAAFRGRRQLIWSRGLKDLIGEPPTDDDIANEQPEGTVLAQFNHVAWSKIKTMHLLGWLLDVAENEGQWGVTQFLFDNDISEGVFCPAVFLENPLSNGPP